MAARIAGLDIPSTAPLFLALLAVHVLAGLTAVTSGAVAALSRKGSRIHLGAGRTYLGAITTVFLTALALAALRWPYDNHLAALGTVAFGAAALGYLARRRHWPGDRAHILGMGVSYVVMLTAFYVDNGHQLPVWDRLPTVAYWMVPSLVGAPLIVRALLRRRA